MNVKGAPCLQVLYRSTMRKQSKSSKELSPQKSRSP